MYKLAPGVERHKVEATLRRLNPIRHSFKPLMLKSYTKDILPGDDQAAHLIIMNEGLPLVWSYLD